MERMHYPDTKGHLDNYVTVVWTEKGHGHLTLPGQMTLTRAKRTHSSLLQCEDQKVECLYEALKRAGDRALGSFPATVPLVLHSSISYLGFFINDSPADVIRGFAMAFATEASILAGRQPRSKAHTSDSCARWLCASQAIVTRLLGQ
jgi:hypothetical protein